MSHTHTITIEALGREVECREDQAILDACLRAGVWLPHACGQGICGSCKVQLLEGEVEDNDASRFALLECERNEGKTLTCVATPSSDVVIEAGVVGTEEGVTYHPVKDCVGTVVAVEDVAVETKRLLVDLDGGIVFNPGQYVMVRVPGTGQTRSYSMANPPAEADQIELHVRRTPGGLATDGWIFNTLKAGDRLHVSGPYGRFFLREARSEPGILIGSGTGVAPLKSIVRHVLEGGHEHRLYLYQGARTQADLYDVEVYRALEKEHSDQFTYCPCLSEEHWEGSTGFVADVVDADFESCRWHTAYVCGPPPMVEAAVKMLMRKRIFPKDVYREDFFDASDKATGGVRSPLLMGGAHQ